MGFDPTTWERVTRLFEAVLEQSPKERAEFLNRATTDIRIRSEVFRLLGNHEDMGDFLSEYGSISSAPLSPPTFSDGERLADRFRVVELIARGGMGEIYSALDLVENDRVAIKTIRSDILSPKSIKRFREEVKHAKRVTHPNVCRVYDLFQHHPIDAEPVFFVSMQLLEGETLAARLSRVGQLSPGEALPLSIQIAGGLGAAHYAGILHRDLKPENVMLIPENVGFRAVIMDFGVASAAESFSGEKQIPSLTGTPAYMSPEQLEGREVTSASDVYAFGLLMYRMLTGFCAFKGSTSGSNPIRIAELPTPLRETVPELDPRWDAVILKCLEPDPSQRFPTAHAAEVVLKGISLGDNLPNTPKTIGRVARIGIYTTIFALAIVATVFLKGFSPSGRNFFRPASQDPALMAGLRALEGGDAMAGEALLQRAVGAMPNSRRAHALLSAAFLSLGYESRAKKEADLANKLVGGSNPEDQFLVRGQRSESVFDFQAAVKSFETLHALAPEEPEWTFRYAMALSRVGRQREGMRAIERLEASNLSSELVLGAGLIEASLAESLNDYSQELKIAARVETIAKSKGHSYQLGHAELSQGWALDNLARYSEAEAKLVSSKDVLSAIGDKGGEGQAWKLLGDVYADQNRLQESKSAYLRAELLFDSIGWESGKAIALNNCGYVLKDLGDLQGARSSFEHSLSMARISGNLRIQGLALNGTAIVLKRMGNFAGAVQAYSFGIDIANRLGDEGSLATRLNNLATVYKDQGKLDEAEDTFQKALLIFQRLGRQSDVAMVLGNLGDVKAREGDLESASKFYKSDVRLARLISQPNNLGYAFLGLGEICFLRSDLKQAREYLDQSLKIREKLHEAGNVSESLLALAELDLEERHFVPAEKRAMVAAAEFSSEGQEGQAADAQAILAQSLVGQKMLTQASSVADAAMRRLNSSEDRESQISSRLHLSRVLSALGRRNEARRTLQTVLLDATQSHYLPWQLEARLSLVQLEENPKKSRAELVQIRRVASAKGLLFIFQKSIRRHN